MRLFRVLSRVAFICNICFVLTALVQWLPHPPEGDLLSTIIVLGYFLAIVINILLNLTLIVLLIAGKLAEAMIPIWLLCINFLFFILQSIFVVISFQ